MSVVSHPPRFLLAAVRCQLSRFTGDGHNVPHNLAYACWAFVDQVSSLSRDVCTLQGF